VFYKTTLLSLVSENSLLYYSSTLRTSVKKSSLKTNVIAVSLVALFQFPSLAIGKNTEAEIEQIEVIGQNQDKQLLSSGFNVEVLLTEEFKNGNYDLVDILQRSPGINVRRSGGLGSDFNLALNGLSGNKIRYFFDGIPMEDFGSALSFPASLVERIEVYKGVAPVSLGSDALGGAVNVTTPELNQDILALLPRQGKQLGSLSAQHI
jgi:outer membrane cobalamin receptor